jgi:hypothetical protein
MLPRFSAASSLYRSRHVYVGYGAASGDIAKLAGASEMVIPANGTIPGSWCDAYTHCPPGTTCCQAVTYGGVPYAECVDLRSDPNNCGSCLNECRSGVCCGGECIAQRDDSCGCPSRPCPPGHKCCTVLVGEEAVSKCINVVGDIENCGSCGHRCPSGQTCCNGTCCSSSCCGGKCCSSFAKCVNDRCCYPEPVIAVAAAIMCLLTLGSDCDAIYQQLQSQACP